MRLALSQIRLDGGAQSRAALNEQALADYCDAMGDGEQFPPVVVFHDGQAYWLADGFHRVRAAERACLVEIDADVRQGSQRDAVLFSVGANASHGLRRTNEDKRRAVRVLLEDAEWSTWSDREIARRAGVSDRFVSSLRPAPGANGSHLPATRTGADGKQYPAKRQQPAAQSVPPASVAQPQAPAPVATVKPGPKEGFFAAHIEKLRNGERGTPISDSEMPPPHYDPYNPPTSQEATRASPTPMRPAMPTGERDRLESDARAGRLQLAVGQALSALRSEAPAEDRIASAVRVLLAVHDGGAR